MVIVCAAATLGAACSTLIRGGAVEAGSGHSTPITNMCVARPTNRGGIIGPSTPWAGPASNQPPPRYSAETIGGIEVWVPAQYTAAQDGEVAILFASQTLGNETFRGSLERLMVAGIMPPTFLVSGGGIDWAEASDASGSTIASRAERLETLLKAVKARYPKLSSAANMHALAGHSTAGAVAFDLAWARPDLFGKVLGVSASFEAFQRWLFPYPTNIDARNKDKVRLALSVAECDLVHPPALVPRACHETCSSGTCICVGCDKGNWVQSNQAAAQKLIALGYQTQLLIIRGGQHDSVNMGNIDGLTYLWRDVVCPN